MIKAMDSIRSKEMNISRKAIQREYKRFGIRQSINPNIGSKVYALMNKRINDRGVRSLFTRLVHRYVQEQALKEQLILCTYNEALFDAQLPFIAETIITIQYYENQILDLKGGVRNNYNGYSKDKIDHNTLASHIIKDDLYAYVDQIVFPDDWHSARLLHERLRNIFTMVDLGQFFQDEYGTLESWENGFNEYKPALDNIDSFVEYSVINLIWENINIKEELSSYEWFIRNYLKRIYLTSASLFVEMARLVMDLLGYTSDRGAKEREHILKFAALSGMVGQIVNDNNDFALPDYQLTTISKVPEDAFADLRNNNITLPIIYFLAKSPSNTKMASQYIQLLNHRPSFINYVLDKIGRTMNLSLFTFDYKINKIQRRIFYSISDSIEKSMRVSSKLAGIVYEKKWIQEGYIGAMLLDINSVALPDYNKFYRAINETIKENVSQPAIKLSKINKKKRLAYKGVLNTINVQKNKESAIQSNIGNVRTVLVRTSARSLKKLIRIN